MDKKNEKYAQHATGCQAFGLFFLRFAHKKNSPKARRQ